MGSRVAKKQWSRAEGRIVANWPDPKVVTGCCAQLMGFRGLSKVKLVVKYT